MKNIKWIWLLVCSMVLSTPVFISCGKSGDDLIEKPEDDNSSYPEIPDTPEIPESSYLSSAEQKKYLDVVGQEFIAYVKANEFKNIVDLTEYMNDVEYDSDEVEEWAERCLEDITEVLDSYEKHGYYYTAYSRLYAASNFTGHFTVKNGEWKYSKANDLQFCFKDQSGKECILKLEASKNAKKVYVGSEEEYDYDYDGYKYYEYIDNYENYIMVPEIITVILTQGGKSLAEFTMTTDLKMIDGEDFNLEKDTYNISASLKVNDYEYKLDKALYKAQSTVNITMNMTKGKTKLLSVSASVNTKVKDEELSEAKNAKLEFDILGKVKIAGTCTDIAKLAEKLEKADDNCENEGTFKSYITEANSMMSLKVYYEGTDKEQASLKLEPFFDNDWGYGEWIYEPVICFNDGTGYSTFEAFFDEDDFEDFIQVLDKLTEDFEDFV